MTAGFRRSVNKIFALLGYYAVLSDSYRRFGATHLQKLSGFRLLDLEGGTDILLVINYQPALRNTPEERIFQNKYVLFFLLLRSVTLQPAGRLLHLKHANVFINVFAYLTGFYEAS